MVININHVETRPRHLFTRACWSAKYGGNREQFSSHQGNRSVFSWNWGALEKETRMQPKDRVNAVCTLRSFFLQVTLTPPPRPIPVPSKHSKHCILLTQLVLILISLGNASNPLWQMWNLRLQEITYLPWATGTQAHTVWLWGLGSSSVPRTGGATPCIRTTKGRGWSGQGKEGFESYPELELRICKAKRKRNPY